MRKGQKVKGLLKKTNSLKIYRNETNITFQSNPPRFQCTGSLELHEARTSEAGSRSAVQKDPRLLWNQLT
jgi:hypothetical protein